MVSPVTIAGGRRDGAARHAPAGSEPGPGKPCIQGLVGPIRASSGALQARRTRNPRSASRPPTLEWSAESALSDIRVHRCIACHDGRPTCPIMPQVDDVPEPSCAGPSIRADGAPRPRQPRPRPAGLGPPGAPGPPPPQPRGRTAAAATPPCRPARRRRPAAAHRPQLPGRDYQRSVAATSASMSAVVRARTIAPSAPASCHRAQVSAGAVTHGDSEMA